MAHLPVLPPPAAHRRPLNFIVHDTTPVLACPSFMQPVHASLARGVIHRSAADLHAVEAGRQLKFGQQVGRGKTVPARFETFGRLREASCRNLA